MAQEDLAKLGFDENLERWGRAREAAAAEAAEAARAAGSAAAEQKEAKGFVAGVTVTAPSSQASAPRS